MTRLRKFSAKVRARLGRNRRERVLDDEIREHLELLTEEHRRRGLSPRDARAAARRDFGGIPQMKEVHRHQREGWVAHALSVIAQDLRQGMRSLRKQPTFTATVTLTLAIGLGSAAAIFEFVDRMFLRPLPVQEPGRLFNLGVRSDSGINMAFSYPEYLDYRRSDDAFAGLVAFDSGPTVVLDAGNGAERAQAALVSANFFSVLGVAPIVGRTFHANEDEAQGSHPVAVLSYGAWQRLFSGSTEAVGRTVRLNGHVFTVIGVAPEEFSGLTRGVFPALFVPVTMLAEVRPSWTARPLSDRHHAWLGVTARLPAAMGAERAAHIATNFAGTPSGVTPALILSEGWQGRGERVRSLRPPARLFTAAAVLLLFIVWANVAGLFLARAGARLRETATRLALGASRGRLAAQLLTESFLITGLGGTLGLICAHGLGQVLGKMLPAGALVPAVHFRTVVFAWVLTLTTAVLVGVVPALLAAQSDVLGALKSRGSTTSGWPRLSWRKLLVVAQLGLSVIALFAAGLCLQSGGRLDAADTGIDDRSVLLATFDASAAGMDPERGVLFFESLQERVMTLPGVANVSFTHIVPFEGRSDSRTLGIPGYLPAAGENMNISQNWVGPDYFATLRVPLLRGREFQSTDRGGSAPVVVVNEAFARRFWPDQDPVGKTISYAASADREVIGLVKDHRARTPAEAAKPMIYLPYLQRYQAVLTLVARADAEATALVAAVRGAARSLHREVTPFNIRTLATEKDQSLAGGRRATEISSIFGLLCLIVSAVGLYGVMAQAVSQRTREIAIRVAMGAAQSRTMGLVLRDAMRLAGLALVPGLVGAFGAGRLLSSMLYEPEILDLPTVAAVTAILGFVAFVAAWLPARRAANVDPMLVLRAE